MEKIDKDELKRIFNEIKTENKEKAVEELYNKYGKLIYGIAFSILKSKEDSEDILQNVITKIYNLNIDKLPTDKEATWIYTVTKNEALEFVKKKNKEVNIDDIYEIEDDNNELNKVIDKESFNNLIKKLNKREKEIITLKIISNLSFKEIGSLIGEPISTVKWRYYNSFYKIKLLLSNLAILIISFTVGIFTTKNTKKSSDMEIENASQQSSAVMDNDTYKQNVESIQDSFISSEENTTNEAITVEPEIKENNVNYLRIGAIGLSFIFLILIIINIIFIKKVQLKQKNKII